MEQNYSKVLRNEEENGPTASDRYIEICYLSNPDRQASTNHLKDQYMTSTYQENRCIRISNHNPCTQFLLLLILSSFTVVGQSCSYIFTSKKLSGNFSSPDFPKYYPKSLNCRYLFVGNTDERIRITFSIFELKEKIEFGCLFDYVDVFTIDGNDREFKGRYCGDKKPRSLLSVSPSVELLFVTSDQQTKKRGFTGVYEFINETWQYYSHSALCKEQLVYGVGGQLMSPGYPHPHPSNVECTWVIKVQKEKEILLSFEEMDLGNSVQCKENSNTVTIFNGFASDMKKPELRVCGKKYFYNRGMREFVSTSYRVTVRFKASPIKDQKSRGFLLAWTAVRKPKSSMDKKGNYIVEPCYGFHCLGGEYCIDTKGLLCNPLPRYCIDESLRCNDINNCGMSDHSDESGCYWKVIIIVSSTLGPLIFIVLAVIITCLIVRHWRLKKSSSQDQALTMQLQKLDRSPSMKRKAPCNTNHHTNKHLRNGGHTESCSEADDEHHFMSNLPHTVVNRHAQLRPSPRMPKYSYQLVVNSQPSVVSSHGKSSDV